MEGLRGLHLESLYPRTERVDPDRWREWLDHPLTVEYLVALRREELALRTKQASADSALVIAKADGISFAAELVLGSLTNEGGKLIRQTTAPKRSEAKEE